MASRSVPGSQASRALGYELRRWHVGMVLWAEPEHEGDSPITRLEAAAREVAAAVGCSRPLTIPSGRSLLWSWCGTPEPVAADSMAALTRGRRQDGVSVALGQPGDSVPGFARFTAAARRLGIHENTAKYRIRQCEEILGRTTGERSLKLEAALVLADTMSRRR